MNTSKSTLREGVVLGLIGYATVAAFYAVFDFLAARGSLYTVNLLGLAVFEGLRDPAVLQLPISLDAVAIGLFNAVHLMVSIAIGVVIAWLVSQIEGGPSHARLALFAMAAGFLVTIFGIGMLSEPVRDLLPWWSVVLANVFAVCVGALYVLRRHPGLFGRIRASLARKVATA